MTHVIGDAAFVGDTLFMPDGGTARADFPGGDARVLYRSIRGARPAAGDAAVHVPRLRAERAGDPLGNHRRRGARHNIHVRDGISEEEFVAMRTARDKTSACRG